MKRLSGILLAVVLLLTLNLSVFADESTTPTTLIDGETVWSYLDNNTDPAGDSSAANYNRTAWTAEGFDTAGWKTAAGSFGSKRGSSAYDSTHTAATVLDGCDGSNNTPAYFFRTTFTVSNLENYTKLTGSLEYDDGVIVYINGQRVAAGYDNACDENGNSLGHGFDTNLQYGGSNQGPDTLQISLLDLSVLHNGENTIAVELHNGRKTSSDVWFAFNSLELSNEPVAYQNNISLSVGADQSQMNFTWYSPLENAEVTVSENDDMTNGNAIAATVVAANDGQYSCKATATGLNPSTTYYYQLSNNNGKAGKVHSFTTGGNSEFSFALVGDPQIGAGNTASDTAGWENTLNTAAGSEIFSDVSFLVSAGDQVNTASDEAQYDGYLDHNVLLGLPVATVIGNHDSGSNAYSQHFNIANESKQYGVTAAGGDYYFVYNNTLFLVLNSNAQSEADVNGHEAFIQAAVEATKDRNITWKVAVFHHTLFTVASHAHDGYIDNAGGFKNLMIPVLKENDIDVVLSGHDHVYCRTYMMDGTTPVTQFDGYEYSNGEDKAPTAVTNPDGILYITANSGSGSKTYGILNETFPFSAVQNQENAANISKVTVSDTAFTITTYRVSDMSVIDSFTIKKNSGTQAANPIIEQVYGGGGKGETPISNSFIELYNPSEGDIDLSAYSLKYGDKTLPLNGVIPANGSFLVVGAAEATTDEFLTYDLPQADWNCDWTINNKSYTIELIKDGAAVNSVTAGNTAETTISKQKSLKRDENGNFTLVVWEKTGVTVDDTYVMDNAPRNSNGDYGRVHTVAQEPTYTPVVAGDARVKGFYNEHSALQMELAARYNSGAMNADGGSLEIVAYNPVNGFAYAVSGVKGKLIAVDLNGNNDDGQVKELNGTEYDVKSLVDGFDYGDMTSVAVSPDGSMLAVAIQAENYAKQGVAALFSCEPDGSLTLLSNVEVGVQPDMITFADNNTILTADEGEPREGADADDPKGSVSIVKIDAGNVLTANTVYFDSFDAKRDELAKMGVLIQKNTQPSTDFEPEYIAVSGNTAYVSLQEANAIAALDIASGSFTGVYPLGFQNYAETKIDLQKNDTIELKNYPNVYGIRMPDGISVTTIGEKTYLLTANEGDSRADWAGLDNEYENVTSPTGNVTLDKKVVWFNANMWDGLDSEKAYVFGGRSFSIYEATDNGLTLVYDSGSGFEEITAQMLPTYFNTSNDKNSADNRSGKKGPEPESVVTGVIGEKTYAFIALERIGGIMVYDITDPANVHFANYINSREFDDVIKGDVSPEGLCFIPEKSLLLAACEVSGTLAAYECKYEQSDEPKPEVKPEYKFLEGDNAKWLQNSDGTLTFRVDGDISKFTGIKVDGNPVDASNYTAKSGSTIVTLKDEYLKTLPVGLHTIIFVYTDGVCSTQFEVQKAAGNAASEQAKPTESKNTDTTTTTATTTSATTPKTATTAAARKTTIPQTGDNSMIFLWVVLLFISGAGALGTVVLRKGKKSK